MLQASLVVYHCVMDRRMNCSGSTAVCWRYMEADDS
ncbi:hypothetical protein DET47_107232 [Shewanella putrefaciens]|nr:hypothetical protein DET47_107232 [Shewanella putrefaciens]